MFKELKIDRRTLFVFTSHDGPHSEGGTSTRCSTRTGLCLGSSATCTKMACPRHRAEELEEMAAEWLDDDEDEDEDEEDDEGEDLD